MSLLTFTMASQSWSKTSFAMTLLRISEGKMYQFLWAAMITMNILFGLGGLSFWVSCTPVEKTWRPQVEGKCWNLAISISFTVFVGGK